MAKPILCLDFDGVLHSYESGWHGVDEIRDPMTPGTATFLVDAVEEFDVQVFSSRSDQEGGMAAMKDWLQERLCEVLRADVAWKVFTAISWPTTKPPAMVTIDDRAITFTGEWPSVESLLKFKPWNKP